MINFTSQMIGTCLTTRACNADDKRWTKWRATWRFVVMTTQYWRNLSWNQNYERCFEDGWRKWTAQDCESHSLTWTGWSTIRRLLMRTHTKVISKSTLGRSWTKIVSQIVLDLRFWMLIRSENRSSFVVHYILHDKILTLPLWINVWSVLLVKEWCRTVTLRGKVFSCVFKKGITCTRRK